MRWLLVAALVGTGCVYQIEEPSEAQMSGWSQSGNLITQQPDAPTVSLQANFDEPAYYTIQFGVQAPQQVSPATLSSLYSAYADVFWTVNGNIIQRQIDIGQGTTISGPGQAVKVIIHDQTPSAAAIGGTFVFPYVVSAQITPGARPTSISPPTRYAQFTAATAGGVQSPTNGLISQIAASGSLIFYVPPNCGAVSVEVTASGGVDSTKITIGQVTGNTELKGYYLKDQPGFVDLIPNCDSIVVQNNDSGSVARVSVNFGIDG